MSHNTWIHRIVRAGVRPLARTQVSPDHLTTLRLFTGIAAAGLIATGVAPWMQFGAAVFVFSMFLDRADGELARLTGKMSQAGHRYDLFSDAFCNSLAFVAIGISLRDGYTLGYWAIPMGAVAGIAIALNLWLVMAIEEMKGSRAAELGSFMGFDADDATLILPLSIWFGWEAPMVVMACAFAPLFTIWASWHFTRLHHLAQSPFAELYQAQSRAAAVAPVLQRVEQTRPHSS